MARQKMFSDRETLQNKFNNTRLNLLLVVAFTAINIFLLVTNSDTYFLFSAYIPYALVSLGMMLCGMYPAEYYGEDLVGVEFFDKSVFAVLLVIAAIITALYLISWIFSKNNKVGWLIFALVIFSLDTAGLLLLGGFDVTNIIDIAFHGWVIVSLATGINACSKLKNMPVEEAGEIEESDEEDFEADDYYAESSINSGAIRVADPDVKSRILLEAEALGHVITYRRVKRVNELVIDGKVYDEYEALVESAHSLTARIDGHDIEAGFDGVAHSYLLVDEEEVAKKLRLY